MIFTDGECPRCEIVRLHLNESDLMECPHCSLVFSAADPLAAACMPFLGEGRFRLEDSDVAVFNGALLTKSMGNTCLADYKTAFKSIEDLKLYAESLGRRMQPSEEFMLLRRFLDAFAKSWNEYNSQSLMAEWLSRPLRTKIYAEIVMPGIAKSLKLSHRKEKFTVDHALVKVSINDHDVPQIYIESENDFPSATHEVTKLCSLNTSLRVLVTATEKKFLPQPMGGAYAQVREWQSIVKAHSQENRHFTGLLAVIVGRKIEEEINFEVCAFHATGELALPLDVFLRVKVQDSA